MGKITSKGITEELKDTEVSAPDTRALQTAPRPVGGLMREQVRCSSTRVSHMRLPEFMRRQRTNLKTNLSSSSSEWTLY